MLEPSALAGTVAITALSLVLTLAAAAKLTDAAVTRRGQGVAELVAAAAALLAQGDVAGELLAVLFLAFTMIHIRRLVAGSGNGADQDCDCLGEGAGAPPLRAAILTGVAAALAGTAVILDAPSVRQLVTVEPLALAAVLPLALLAGIAWRLAFTGPRPLEPLGALPNGVGAVSDRLVDSSAQLLEWGFADHGSPADGLSRRSLLLRVAVVGSALTVAPLRYLLYPGSALAAIAPSQCDGGLCTDGYTGFCCEINKGHVNACPEGTFPGGWWMCTNYSGRQLCAEQGVRYYVDCNALPGRPFPGGCRCGVNSCRHRRINCNIFRYGQCNTEIGGVTAVVCRMVVCENPGTIEALHCSAALAVDDATCDNEAGCLEPQAAELVGAGGV
ncbi:MAG TPA: hypothetical protein VMV16_04265 [Solirubrobacteraceae bacterium]|nr:hypothetical protein [Solirubrobacteraceae bacterium]